MDDINDIENKLKQGANEPVFEFKDQYWEDALIVLKQAEKDARKKRFFIFLLYLLGGLALISGTAFYLFNDNSKSTDALSSAKNNSTNTIVNSQNKGNETSINTSNNQAHDVKDDDLELIDNQNDPQENTLSNGNVDQLKSSNNEGKDANDLKLTTNKSFNLSDVGQLKDNSNPSKLKTVNANNSKGDLVFVAEDNSSNKNVIDQKNQETVKVNDLEKLNSILIDPTKDQIISNKLPNETIPVISLENKWMLVANVGTNFSQSLGEGESAFDVPNAGLEVYYQFNNKLNLSLGGTWYKKSNLDLVIPNTNTLSYSFGSKSSSEIIQLKELSFVEIPLKLSFQWRRNHLISTGFSYSYILGGKSTRSFVASGNDANGVIESSETKSEELGYYPNLFTKGTFDLFVGYEWRFGRFGLEGRYYQGINDFTKTFTHQEAEYLTDNHRNSRFVFYLKYLIIK